MAPFRLLQIVDDSPGSEYAFKWTRDHILQPRGDDFELTILSVATPHPAPDYLASEPSMFTFSSDPILAFGIDIPSPQMRQAEYDRANQEAYNVAHKYYQSGVAAGLTKECIQLKVVSEIDGIGRAVQDFCEKEKATFDLCVCGSRGMGSFKRFMTGIADSLGLGLGSVSDYCVHHLPFPVLVIKQPQDAQTAKHAAEAHMEKGSHTSKATTMQELRGSGDDAAEAAVATDGGGGGATPLKVTTIPPGGKLPGAGPETPTGAVPQRG